MTALPPVLIHPCSDHVLMNEQTNLSFDVEPFDYPEKKWKQLKLRLA